MTEKKKVEKLKKSSERKSSPVSKKVAQHNVAEHFRRCAIPEWEWAMYEDEVEK